MKTKKKIIIIALTIFLTLITLFVALQLMFPKISISNFGENYEYSDLINETYKVKTSLFHPKKNTVWNINGYDFYQGKEVENIPVVIGENTLTITNGKATNIYKFNVTNSNPTKLLLTDEEEVISADYLDYDRDGIPNIKEKELGLAGYTNDTDNDGLLDNVELAMGLDPKTKDSYDKVREYQVTQDNKENFDNYVIVNGKGNIANTFLDTEDLNVGLGKAFIKSDVVKVSTSNIEKPENMTIYFAKEYTWNTDNYSIYMYDDGELTELPTESNNDHLFANISIFDNLYFIGKKDDKPTSEYTNQIMILIDNSGSMFSKAYVDEKNGVESTDDENMFGNDIGFNRLSLMSSLVQKLGVDKYEYSIYSFTSDYCDIVKSSNNQDAIINGINSLKTECQNFNGTSVTGAIQKYASNFKDDVYGNKYMIVLTDGIDSGAFTFKLPDYSLNNYKKDGIKIFTIGLGKQIDSEYLMNIASKTNGKYLYASDSNMLDTLINIIESSISNQQTKIIDDKEVTLVADSGFEVTRDGFPFENFGTSDEPTGNCYGFSSLTKDIYLNRLKVSGSFESNFFDKDSSLMAYLLTDKNKERLVKGNVYNIKLNNAYSTLLSTTGNEEDYRYVGEDGIPYLNEKYKSLTPGTGFTPSMKDLGTDTTELTINGITKKYSKYESLGKIDVNSTDVSNEYKDDFQIVQLINRYQRSQKKHVSDKIAEAISLASQGKFYDYENQVKQIINELKTGSPSFLSIVASEGKHSILATRVYKSNDLEQYIIDTYDSNVSDKEGKMYLERQIPFEKFVGTSYYSFKYNEGGFEFYNMIYAGEF